jgi:hypothetical protein
LHKGKGERPRSENTFPGEHIRASIATRKELSSPGMLSPDEVALPSPTRGDTRYVCSPMRSQTSVSFLAFIPPDSPFDLMIVCANASTDSFNPSRTRTKRPGTRAEVRQTQEISAGVPYFSLFLQKYISLFSLTLVVRRKSKCVRASNCVCICALTPSANASYFEIAPVHLHTQWNDLKVWMIGI